MHLCFQIPSISSLRPKASVHFPGAFPTEHSSEISSDMMSSTPPLSPPIRHRCLLAAAGLKKIVLLASIFIATCSSKSVIETLPGFPGKLPFTLETGYIGVGETEEVQLFYYFVESESNPQEDPLVLWLTGGPGCSGLSGLIYEIGPFTMDYEKSSGHSPILKIHEYSWTKVANIIFLDQPVGTGFSYANTSEAYKTSDTLAATHIHSFLAKWLIEHPQYLTNPLYISGDSYSGIAVTLAVNEVYKGIAAGIKPLMNIKGYTLGNPLTDDYLDVNGRTEYAYHMGLVSKALYQSAEKNCLGNYIAVDPHNVLCQTDIEKVQECIKRIRDGHILEPYCDGSPFVAKREVVSNWDESYHAEIPSNFILQPTTKSWCRDDNYVLSTKWANIELVQIALHVREGTVLTWARCNESTVHFKDPMAVYSHNVPSVVGYHHNFTSKSCRALVYSGDHDLKIPHVSTEKWIDSLKLPIQSDWRPWFVDDQVGGYTIKYGIGDYELTYATVKGGGHTAPEYKPKECLAMMKRWFQHSSL